MRSATITIGDETFTIAPLTLGQLEDAWPIATEIFALRSVDGSARLPRLLIDFLDVALREDNPTIDVRKLRGTLVELQTAFMAVMDVSGYETGAAQPGGAPAPAVSTSAGSSAPSQPAAAIPPPNAAS